MEELEQTSSSKSDGLKAAGSLQYSTPTDVSFLYRGYAPLTIRLIEHALKSQGWSSVGEVSVTVMYKTYKQDFCVVKRRDTIFYFRCILIVSQVTASNM
jgi:hypothetical protein